MALREEEFERLQVGFTSDNKYIVINIIIKLNCFLYFNMLLIASYL